MKKRFLLRVDPAIYEALEKWAADDLRSVNAQIEFLLQQSLRRAGRKVRQAPQRAVVPQDAPQADGSDEE